MLTSTTLPFRAGLLGAVALAGLTLAACNKDAGPAAQVAPPQAALPLTTASSGPVETAPPAQALPPAPRARVARLVDPRQRYGYLDNAYAMSRGFADAPPDYSVDYNGVRPWVWRSDSGAYRVVESVPGGERDYYYQPGASTPFLVRDPQYAYGYDNGQLVIVYDHDGRVLPPDAIDSRADTAGRFLYRAARLFEAANQQQHEAVARDDWFARRQALQDQRAAWESQQSRYADWQAYHAEHDQEQQAGWADERWHRQAEAARLAAQVNDRAEADRAWRDAQAAQAIAASRQQDGRRMGPPGPPNQGPPAQVGFYPGSGGDQNRQRFGPSPYDAGGQGQRQGPQPDGAAIRDQQQAQRAAELKAQADAHRAQGDLAAAQAEQQNRLLAQGRDQQQAQRAEQQRQAMLQARNQQQADQINAQRQASLAQAQQVAEQQQRVQADRQRQAGLAQAQQAAEQQQRVQADRQRQASLAQAQQAAEQQQRAQADRQRQASLAQAQQVAEQQQRAQADRQRQASLAQAQQTAEQQQRAQADRQRQAAQLHADQQARAEAQTRTQQAAVQQSQDRGQAQVSARTPLAHDAAQPALGHPRLPAPPADKAVAQKPPGDKGQGDHGKSTNGDAKDGRDHGERDHRQE